MAETLQHSIPVPFRHRLMHGVAAMCTRLGQGLTAFGESLTSGPARHVGEAGADRFASLASMIPGVVYQRIVKPDGSIRYTYISEGSREIFGVEPDEVLKDSESLFRTYSDEYKANFRRRLLDASRTLTKWDVEASFVSPDGQTRFTHAIAKPERLEDGSVLWTGLILDATRIKQVEEELKSANRSVEAANNAKSLFLANMSHEIRTPMNGVLGMAELLLRTDLNGRQQRLLTTLKHSAQTLLGIINDVLDISRIEAGHFRLEHEAFDPQECLEDAIDLCAASAYQKGLELNLVIDGALPGMVRGDAGRLRQVLINLLGNAVKFTETGDATLRASSRRLEDGREMVTLQVIDTGIGIDDAAKLRLFAPFVQADSSISRRFGGTGLGLAITRHLVTLMGGKVGIESEIGRGTCVTVELPLEVVSSSGQDKSSNVLAGYRVLVVDDRAGVRETLAAKLDGTGAVVEQTGSGEMALNMLGAAAGEGRPYAAVIIDRLQAGAENMDFPRQISADPRHAETTVVKIVSMNWRGEIAATDHGARMVALAKPVRRQDLLGALIHREGAMSGGEQARADDMQPTADGEAEAPYSSRRLGLNVLLAEDNPVNQEVAREYVSGFGCRIETVQNGEEAVQANAREAFDIVLMDCQMPVLDGLSAARRIRADELATGSRRVPIIAVTANAYDSDRVEALAAGMDDYLVKPFSEEALGAMLEKWSGRAVDQPARDVATGASEHAANNRPT